MVRQYFSPFLFDSRKALDVRGLVEECHRHNYAGIRAERNFNLRLTLDTQKPARRCLNFYGDPYDDIPWPLDTQPHKHHSDFVSAVLYGNILERMYEETPGNTHVRYKVDNASGSPQLIELPGTVALRETAAYVRNAGETYRQSAPLIHVGTWIGPTITYLEWGEPSPVDHLAYAPVDNRIQDKRPMRYVDADNLAKCWDRVFRFLEFVEAQS